MINFIIYNVIVSGIYYLIDFFCIQLGIYQPLTLSNLTHADIYMVVFNIFISSVSGYYLMRYIKRNFFFEN